MSDKKSGTSTEASDAGAHTAGAFDIRNIIGALLGIYGVALVLAGLFMDKEEAKTGGINANLWTGLALTLAAAVFLIWARLKPIVVPAHVEPAEPDPTRPGPTRQPGAR